MKDDLSYIGVDDLHPTVRGYDAMATIYFDAIKITIEGGRHSADSGGDRSARASDPSNDVYSLTSRVRAYWNERIHDLEMTSQPVGTRAFFDELDDYRFDKLAYLPRVIDFGGYEGKRLVEVGCGVGTDLVRFARGGARVLGVDLSETAVALAGRTSPCTDSAAPSSSATARALPLPDGSQDVVYAHGVLQYAADPRRIVEEVLRVLVPGDGDLHGLQPRVVAARAVEADEGRTRARGCARC